MSNGFVSWAAIATQQHVRGAARELREAIRVSPDAFSPDLSALLSMLADLDESIETSLEKASTRNAPETNEGAEEE